MTASSVDSEFELIVLVVFVVVSFSVTHGFSPVNVLTDTLRPSLVRVISPS